VSSQNSDGSYTTSSLTGFIDSGNTLHVFYVSSNDYKLVELYRSNGTWFEGYPPGNGPAVNGTGLASLWDGSNERVYLTGLDDNLWEIADISGKGWQETQLTGGGAPGPASRRTTRRPTSSPPSTTREVLVPRLSGEQARPRRSRWASWWAAHGPTARGVA
jgi:hypothetical protein